MPKFIHSVKVATVFYRHNIKHISKKLCTCICTTYDVLCTIHTSTNFKRAKKNTQPFLWIGCGFLQARIFNANSYKTGEKPFRDHLIFFKKKYNKNPNNDIPSKPKTSRSPNWIFILKKKATVNSLAIVLWAPEIRFAHVSIFLGKIKLQWDAFLARFSLLLSALAWAMYQVYLNFMNEMTSFVCLENGSLRTNTHTQCVLHT